MHLHDDQLIERAGFEWTATSLNAFEDHFEFVQHQIGLHQSSAQNDYKLPQYSGKSKQNMWLG